MISLPFSQSPVAGGPVPIPAGSMSAPMGSPGSPGAMISSRSMTLRSSLTLPGQSYACMAAMASSPMLLRGRPADSAARSMKKRASSGMSSRRSRNGGT